MRFHREFLQRYLSIAPTALAAERTLECNVMASRVFVQPVLDIGCGDGVFAHILFDEKLATGIDPDPLEVARARELDAYDELIVCGGATVPKPDGSYNTIFSNSVMEHIPDLFPVVKEAYRLLAPGGHLFVTIPTDRWEASVWPARLLAMLGSTTGAAAYGRFYNRFWNHFHAYPVAQWIELFTSAGFRVEEVFTYASANVTTALDLATPFAAPSMVSKRLLGRWIAFPALRSSVAKILSSVLQKPLSGIARGSDGCLVFLSLAK